MAKSKTYDVRVTPSGGTQSHPYRSTDDPQAAQRYKRDAETEFHGDVTVVETTDEPDVFGYVRD